MSVTYTPEQEGETHINVYSRSETLLGRITSNFERMHFLVPGMGSFASMEAFYYYVSTGERYDHLRKLSGLIAKREGQKLSAVKRDDFDDEMRLGVRSKYNENKHTFDELFITDSFNDHGDILPFVHYYVVGGGRVIVPQGNAWLTEEWTAIRSEFFAANPELLM